MTKDYDKRIGELLGRAYGESMGRRQSMDLERERKRIMRELPRGVRSPLITLRLVVVLAIWSMVVVGVLFFHRDMVSSILTLYGYFAAEQPFPDGFLLSNLPYYMLAVLGIVETYNLSKEVM